MYNRVVARSAMSENLVAKVTNIIMIDRFGVEAKLSMYKNV